MSFLYIYAVTQNLQLEMYKFVNKAFCRNFEFTCMITNHLLKTKIIIHMYQYLIKIVYLIAWNKFWIMVLVHFFFCLWFWENGDNALITVTLSFVIFQIHFDTNYDDHWGKTTDLNADKSWLCYKIEETSPKTAEVMQFKYILRQCTLSPFFLI